jgi:polyferredoxin
MVMAGKGVEIIPQAFYAEQVLRSALLGTFFVFALKYKVFYTWVCYQNPA